MKTVDILRAIYNDKDVLTKFKKSVEEYALNLRSMEQLKNDSKEIEKFIKEKYRVGPAIFKKIVKASLTQNDNTDDVIDEITLIREIAQKSKN